MSRCSAFAPFSGKGSLKATLQRPGEKAQRLKENGAFTLDSGRLGSLRRHLGGSALDSEPRALLARQEDRLVALGSSERLVQPGHGVADQVTRVLDGLADNGADNNREVEAEVKAEAIALCRAFPIYN